VQASSVTTAPSSMYICLPVWNPSPHTRTELDLKSAVPFEKKKGGEGGTYGRIVVVEFTRYKMSFCITGNHNRAAPTAMRAATPDVGLLVRVQETTSHPPNNHRGQFSCLARTANTVRTRLAMAKLGATWWIDVDPIGRGDLRL
jgi:hypothetical protein